MAEPGKITVPVEIQGELMEVVPSSIRPYAKALVSALPPVLTAWAVLQSDHVSPIAVIQFILAILTTLLVYLMPLLPTGRWESGLKTGIAIASAVLSAGLAGFGGGGTEAWFGFGSAALAALLVEIVDNVPNARPAVAKLGYQAKHLAQVIADVPLPDGAPTD